MKEIKWGIIGCGDVTEVKSGPAFNKVAHSSLVAVMRRDASKAEEYARRHHVPKWYSDARSLINDPEVNAIYIATPPSSHESYTLEALQAGKPVYVEKPMALDATGATTMLKAAERLGGRLVVAHYRREQPLFKKIKQLLDEKAIGDTRLMRMDLFKAPLSKEELAVPKTSWRVNEAIAGGGLFHDLAPHQLDLAYHFFGRIKTASGVALNQAGLYAADDMVAGTVLFENGVVFNGCWCFNTAPGLERDSCEITGSAGMIRFSVFDDPLIHITRDGKTERLPFDKLQHVQQPMIEKVVAYFRGEAANPCPAEDGVEVMRLLDQLTRL